VEGNTPEWRNYTLLLYENLQAHLPESPTLHIPKETFSSDFEVPFDELGVFPGFAPKQREAVSLKAYFLSCLGRRNFSNHACRKLAGANSAYGYKRVEGCSILRRLRKSKHKIGRTALLRLQNEHESRIVLAMPGAAHKNANCLISVVSLKQLTGSLAAQR
jgi:hypothetical protein